MLRIDKYYEKANKLIENDEAEEAITTFIAGLDHGCVKCAYGVIHTVMNHCPYTMTEDEAISIFSSSYSKIKLLAEEGDTEAMVMVAEGIRHGFVDDYDEPYLFWLTKAAELGDKGAIAIIEELDRLDDPWMLPEGESFVTAEACEDMDSTDMILLDDRLDLEVFSNADAAALIAQEYVLIADPDADILEQYGITDHRNPSSENI